MRACTTTFTCDIPAGAYDSARLSNLGIGHGAIDAGGGYTYFNPQTGHELSGVLGFTYNFENQSTQYQNGVDMHFDWAASQFLTKQFQIGAVGYVYRQIGCDSGSGNRVGTPGSRSRFRRLHPRRPRLRGGWWRNKPAQGESTVGLGSKVGADILYAARLLKMLVVVLQQQKNLVLRMLS